MRLTRFEWGCVGVVAAAFVVRLLFLAQPGFVWDSAWFLLLARSFGDTGTFYIPWSEPGAPQYSGYWPPLFPVFLAPLVKAFGASYRTLVFGSIVASALLVVAVFFTTRDLFGRAHAFAAAAIVAASPAFYTSDANGMSESLLALMVALAVWAFLKSLDKPIWLPVAGVFAFLAYLGKATLGLPFIAVGVAALVAWRVSRRGWRGVLASRVDLGVAAVALLALAALALTRSGRVGGVGLGLIDPLRQGVLAADCGALVAQSLGIAPPFSWVGPQCWAIAFPLKVAFVAAFLFVVTLPLSLRLPQLFRERRTERTDALWLAVLLPLVAGAVFTTTFFFTEKRQFVDFDNIRYLTPALVPFLWLLLPMWRFDEEPSAEDGHVRRRHLAWYWSAVAALVALFLLNPVTGTLELGRFYAFLLLALVPIGLALVARSTAYVIRERRVGSAIERRFARGKTPSDAPRMTRVAAIVLLVGGLLFSSWHALLAVGMLVAFATPSPGRRAVAMSLLLLASAAPSIAAYLPVDEMRAATHDMPEGTVIGMSEIVVYSAAAAPEQLDIRLVDPNVTIPPDIDVLLLQKDFADRSFDGFTRVAAWDYAFSVYPTLRARLWIEENLLGIHTERTRVPGLVLHVREGSGLEAYVAP